MELRAIERLLDRISVVEERSKSGARQFDKLATVVNQQVPSIEERQKDQARQINGLRSNCDDRLVDTLRALGDNTTAVADVKKSLDTLSTSVVELKDKFHQRANGHAVRIQDHGERLLSLEKQTQVEGFQKRQAEFGELSKRLGQLEKEKEEEKKRHSATRKQLDEMMERMSKLETKGTQEMLFPNLRRPSISATPRRDSSAPPSSSLSSARGHETTKRDHRKRQASPSQLPSRSNPVKRTKLMGPPQTPTATGNDSNDEQQMSPQREHVDHSDNLQLAANKHPAAKTKTPAVPNATSAAQPKNVKAEKPAVIAKRTREPTPDRLTKVAKDKFRYIRELKNFDCTDFPKYKALREEYLASTYQFPLFSLEIKNETYDFFLQTGEKDTVEPCSRELLIGIPKESKQTDTDREIVRDTGVIEACKFGPRGKVFPKEPGYYLVCLGEVYKSMQNTRNNKKESTGWFIFVDVAAKEKPVYMIWREKTYKGDKLICTSNWTCTTFGLEPGDKRSFFVLLPSIDEWPKDPDQNAVSAERIKVVLDTHGHCMHMAFTRPLCASLVQRIEDGWKKTVTFRETSGGNPRGANK